MKEFYEMNREKIEKLLFLAGFVVFLYLFVNYIFQYVAPFIFGYILSLILEPLARILDKRLKINRGLAAFLCILLSIALVFILGSRVVARIVLEVQALYQAMPFYLEEAHKSLTLLKIKFNDIFALVPDSLQVLSEDALASLTVSFTNILGSGVKTGSISVVSFVPNFLLNLLLTFISAFFFIKDKYLLSHFFRAQTPRRLSGKLTVIKKGIFSALLGYVKAQLTMMSIVGAICVVSLSVIGSPYALFTGLIIAFIDALPIFGSGFILWPWAAFCLITGEYRRAVSLLAIYGIVFITRQALEPRILGHQIGIHPLITLMSVYIGLKIFGAPGLILGPVAMVVVKAMQELEPEAHE